ncbi:UNVERIFIED_ORG: hypothetical protein J2Y78_002287 [Buttiauxella agrestis ATCC 33320]
MTQNLTFEYRDEYKRKVIAEKIKILLESKIKTSPIVIDGGWGTGKTEFSIKLAALLESTNDNHKVIYIDAFTEDHNDAPILTIMAAIVALLPQDEKKELISKALPALRFGLKTVFKAGTGWILKQNAEDIADGFEDAIKDVTNSAIDSTVELLLNDHVDAQKNILALKEVLSELTTNNTITIIIDELDRCKPSFAISIIENIKHVFDVDNLNFILVANTSQLKASINHIYGSSVNSEQYLDKFIKFTYSLPVMFKDDNYNDVLTSVSHWTTLCNTSNRLKAAEKVCGHYFIKFIELKKLSLREVETLARYLEIYQLLSENGISDKNKIGYCVYRSLAVILYCFGREIALDYLQDNVVPENLVNLFGLEKFSYQLELHHAENFEYALFGITYKYISEGSPLYPPEEKIQNNWAYVSDYHFMKGTHGISEPPNVLKTALKIFLLH